MVAPGGGGCAPHQRAVAVPGAYVEADLGKGLERVKVLRAVTAEGSGAPGTLLDAAGTVACGTVRCDSSNCAGPARAAPPAARRSCAAPGWRQGRGSGERASLMPRYKLVIEYDGAPFRGWQRQADDPTVQAAIETAVTRFSGETARLTCAGRTDAGVHAIHQVAHLDLAKDWRTDTVRDALNAHLRPQPVAILSAEVVTQEFDARHSAIRRHYRYRILNRRSPAALTRAHVWQVPWPLDAELMHRGRATAPRPP